MLGASSGQSFPSLNFPRQQRPETTRDSTELRTPVPDGGGGAGPGGRISRSVEEARTDRSLGKQACSVRFILFASPRPQTKSAAHLGIPFKGACGLVRVVG